MITMMQPVCLLLSRLYKVWSYQSLTLQRWGSDKPPHPLEGQKRMFDFRPHSRFSAAGFMKVRYRGLAKNANRAYAMLALINVSKWGRALTGEVSTA